MSRGNGRPRKGAGDARKQGASMAASSEAAPFARTPVKAPAERLDSNAGQEGKGAGATAAVLAATDDAAAPATGLFAAGAASAPASDAGRVETGSSSIGEGAYSESDYLGMPEAFIGSEPDRAPDSLPDADSPKGDGLQDAFQVKEAGRARPASDGLSGRPNEAPWRVISGDRASGLPLDTDGNGIDASKRRNAAGGPRQANIEKPRQGESAEMPQFFDKTRHAGGMRVPGRALAGGAAAVALIAIAIALIARSMPSGNLQGEPGDETTTSLSVVSISDSSPQPKPGGETDGDAAPEPTSVRSTPTAVTIGEDTTAMPGWQNASPTPVGMLGSQDTSEPQAPPVTVAPATSAPATSAPATAEPPAHPVTAAPDDMSNLEATQAPQDTTRPSDSELPLTSAPTATSAPATAAPSTSSPTTSASATAEPPAHPVTAAPDDTSNLEATQAPQDTTRPSDSELPLTSAPTATSAPATAAPATSAPATAAPATSAPATAEPPTPPATPAPEDASKPLPEQIGADGFVAPLPGARPYAVMIDNAGDRVLPQGALNKAQVVYEMLVEGGITSFLAVIWPSDALLLDAVGPVQKLGSYFMDYAAENDALLLHISQSPYAQADFESMPVERVARGIYEDITDDPANYQDSYTSADKIARHVAEQSIRSTTEAAPPIGYSLSPVDVSAWDEASAVRVDYSSNYYCEYAYDPETKLYYRSRNGAPHMARNSTDGSEPDERVAVKNVLALFVANRTIDGAGYQAMDNVGSGEGYYFTSGRVARILWTKASREARTELRYADTGEPVLLNPGRVFVQIAPTERLGENAVSFQA